MANNIDIKDGAGSTKTVKTTDNTSVHTPHHNVDTLTTITNVVHVDDNSGSLTVDGTVAATQSGTWNITNVSGTVSLPTGASTAAKQPALGTAGTASADVITVQGIASMTALKVDGSAVTQPVSGTFWQATQPVSLASVPSHAVTNAGTFAVQVDGTGLTRLTDIETNTDSGAVVGNGTAATAQRVTLASDSTGIVSLTTSTASIGKLAANSGVDIGDVDVTSISAGSNVIGDVGLSGRTSGGLTLHSRLSTGSSGEATNVKASAGQLFWAMVTNTNASARYIKFYNSASAPTAGSGTPVLRFLIPPNSSGYQLRSEQGLAFSSGIGYTVVTTAADAGSTSPAADEVIVNLGYR